MPEISAEELNLLRGSASLLDEVWNDPKHGLALKRAVKDKRPNVSIPEIDVPDVVLRPINDQMSALQAAMAKGCQVQVGTDMLFEMIPAYLEFFGFGSSTPEELRAVATLSY